MSGSRQNFGVRLAVEGQDQIKGALEQIEASAERAMTTVSTVAGTASGKLVVLSGAVGQVSQALEKAGFGTAATALQNFGTALDVVSAAATRFGGSAAVAEVSLGAFVARMAGVVTVAAGVAAGLQAAGLGINSAGTAAQSATQYASTYEAAMRALNSTLADTAERAAAAAQALFQTQQQARLVQGEQALGQLFEQRSSNVTAYNRTQQDLSAAQRALAQAEERLRLEQSREGRAGNFLGRYGVRDATAEVARRQQDVSRLEGQRDTQAQRNEELNQQERALSAELERNRNTIYPTPAGPDAPAAQRGGGGGGSGRVAQVDAELAAVSDVIRQQPREMEQYARGVESAAQRVVRALDPAATAQEEYAQTLRDIDAAQEEGIFSAERAAELRTAALRDLNEQLDRVGDSTKDVARAGQAAGKALAGAFEDLVFEGASFSDVLKTLERDLLRIGNQTLLQPLFQQGINYLFGAAQGGTGTGSGAGGAIASLISGVGSLFGGSSAASGVSAATQIYATAADVGPLLFHEGGVVGVGGRPGPVLPLGMFANAPRYHSGGTVGSIIGPDERAIVAKVGETIRTPEQEAALRRADGAMTININGVRNPDEFRQSRSQIVATTARAIGRSRRSR